MKVFSVDIKVAATAYIVAETEEEARKVFERSFGEGMCDELPDGGLVDGSSFETLAEEAAESGSFGTISPAVTFYGAFDDEPNFDLVFEAEEAEED